MNIYFTEKYFRVIVTVASLEEAAHSKKCNNETILKPSIYLYLFAIHCYIVPLGMKAWELNFLCSRWPTMHFISSVLQ